MSKRILCVCMGNICRSPLAEAIFRDRIAEGGLDMTVDSAGTGGWHIGDRPDQRAIVAGRLKGYDLTDQKARQLSAADFEQFDAILVMDDHNIVDVEALRPEDSQTPVQRITDGAADLDGKNVPDPYYSGQFGPVLDMLEVAIDNYLKNNT